MTYAIALPFAADTPVPCAGRDVNDEPLYLLFDSTFVPDHRRARVMCLGVAGDPARPPCPALVACRRELDKMLAAPRLPSGPAFEPEGTWAGRRFASRSKSKRADA